MFSKAKRFDPTAFVKNNSDKKNPKNKDEVKKNPVVQNQKNKTKTAPRAEQVGPKSNVKQNGHGLLAATPLKNSDIQSQCSSIKSSKSFVTPKPVKPVLKAPSSLKKIAPVLKEKKINTLQNDVLKERDVEIRNKDSTISEYNKLIEELKNEVASLQKQLNAAANNIIDKTDKDVQTSDKEDAAMSSNDDLDNCLKIKVYELEQQCEKLEQEVTSKLVDLRSMEEVITIRDSLCKDLQEKLTNVESCIEETKQRLEMVKGHHALALEANESIRREYKAELETVKTKFEDEKLMIMTKSKMDQENIKLKYNEKIESIKNEIVKEKDEIIIELQNQLSAKELEMRAKLEQIDEATHEKLRLCEIQFEERTRILQEHWTQQQKQLQYLENETKDLKYSLNVTEEQNALLQKEINMIKKEVDVLKSEKSELEKETEYLKEESKKKLIDFENEINKLTVEVDKAVNEKNKFEMSLSVTRDIVQVLTMRLRESDNELDHLENKLQTLTNEKEVLEEEVTTFKNMLNNTVLECNEYKEALVNILKSKAALAKEHTRIMEHNVSLIESLQNVEKEAYRELGSIKNELIEDVELLKKESSSQIQSLKEEVEKKRMLCELATEHAGQATAAAEQSRALLGHAANEIARLEADNQRLQLQIQDQQSLVVELSLLRQENEELTLAVAKQSSMVDKMKKDAEQNHTKPKSPSIHRKSYKSGKENMQLVSPLRERNH